MGLHLFTMDYHLFKMAFKSEKKNVERDGIDAIRSDRSDALDVIASKKM